MIHKVDYYHIEILDNPGAAFWVLLGLKKKKAGDNSSTPSLPRRKGTFATAEFASP